MFNQFYKVHVYPEDTGIGTFSMTNIDFNKKFFYLIGRNQSHNFHLLQDYIVTSRSNIGLSNGSSL